MKKPVTIILVLIALMAIIGIEQFGKRFHFLVSDDRSARTRQADETVSSEDIKVKEFSVPEHDFPRLAARSRDRDRADTIKKAPIADFTGSRPVAVSITGEISPMHFIRASFIVGSKEPSKEQIDWLHEAVDEVAKALRPGAIIFDADGLSTSQAPFLVFARDEFDLTSQVKSIYDTLEKTSNRPHQENPKVEQVADGNPH